MRNPEQGTGILLRSSRVALKQSESPEPRAQGHDATTAARRAADHVRETAPFVRAAFDITRDLVVICDPYGRIILINRAMEQFTGLDCLGVLPGVWSAYGEMFHLDGGPVADTTAPMARALRGETVRNAEMVLVGVSGRRRTTTVDSEPLFDAAGELLGAIVVWHDITDRRHAEDGLAFHEHHNPLTGLPNRALLVMLVEDALVRQQSLRGSTAVLAINVDHFADIATRLGDHSGDYSGNSLTVEVARLLNASLRRSSGSRPLDMLAHIGGDHFIALCEDVADVGAAKMIARRIAGALGAPMSISGEELSVTACIGITVTRDPRRDAEPLIREAEAAMRQAERRGAGRHETFTGEIGSQRRVRIASESSLRQALATSEFYVEYQPKIRLSTDRTVGVEALLRWMHPERGLISPWTSSRSPRSRGSSCRSVPGCSSRCAAMPCGGAQRCPAVTHSWSR